MIKYSRSLLFLLLLLPLSRQLSAQSLVPQFGLGLDHILDNREYFTPYGNHQTIYGIRINPEVFWSFDTAHQVHLGINYMYEFGGAIDGVTPQLDLYYHFQNEKAGKLDVLLGSFPRVDHLPYPRYALNDSLAYYRPNIEGGLLRYAWRWGHARAWVDWLGRETPEVREHILAGADIRVDATSFLYAHFLTTRDHLARTTAVPDTNSIRDESSLLFFLGADLSEEWVLDELDVSGGWASSYVYDRPSPYVWSHGYMLRLKARYRIFGLRATWYQGDPISLSLSEELYSHGDYARFDLYIDPFRNPRISSRIGWSLHYLPGDGLYHSQQVLVSLTL